MKTNHLEAIRSGAVTKTNVIGIRKAINANWRRRAGYSTSSTAPKLSNAEVESILAALALHAPVVRGDLHDSGLALLRNRRNRRRLERVEHKLGRVGQFRLTGYHCPIEPSGLHAYPVYMACDHLGQPLFSFYCIPWQSGGDGPQLLEVLP